jgi:hypothetical protein
MRTITVKQLCEQIDRGNLIDLLDDPTIECEDDYLNRLLENARLGWEEYECAAGQVIAAVEMIER